jgi:hypothetical protein
MQPLIDTQRRFGTGLQGGEDYSAIQSAYATPFVDPLYRAINLFPDDYIYNILGPYPPMGELPGDPPAIPVPKETEPQTGQPVEAASLSTASIVVLLALAFVAVKFS